MQQIVEAMQPGWNLGNTFEASGSETAWGNPVVTEELIQAIKDQGYKSIRIPVTWNHRMGGSPDYAIDSEFMARLQEVVDWSLEAGLYVMINMHHDSHWMLNMEQERDSVLEKYSAAWRQIAKHFRDYPAALLFEGINEPRFSEDWNKDEPIYFTMLDELNTYFHEIVRSSGGNNGTRPLVLSTVTGSPSQPRLDELYKTIEKLDDPNLIATIHYYGYYPFSVNLGGGTKFDEAARGDLVAAFDRAYDTFVARGIPVIIGEFGLLGFDKSVSMIQHGEVLKFFEYLTYYAREKKMTHMLWDNGQHYDRNALTWFNPDFYEVMHAGLSGRSSNAASDSVYVLQGEAVQDVTVQMNLNGNTLTGIKLGDRELAAGTDYVTEGESLTLKADLLQGLLTDSLGLNATLICTFSAGADWKLHIIQYIPPTARDVEGSRGMFVIPVKYNGDALATMEATYAAGGNAGPDDWTPYKEFGKSFEPDYKSNLVKLPSAFFDQVKEGEVLLKLHFWSGTVLDYKLSIDDSANKIYGDAPVDEPLVQEIKGPVEVTELETAQEAEEAPEPVDQDLTNGFVYLWIGGAVLLLALLGVGTVLVRRRKRK